MSNTVAVVKEALALYEKSYNAANEASRMLAGGPSSYYFQKIVEYVTALFDKYAPFRVGDRVEIVKAPHIPKGSGWESRRHFLIPGSLGTVKVVDYVDGEFKADIIFDDESWINEEGAVIPITLKHTFHMRESEIRKKEQQ